MIICGNFGVNERHYRDLRHIKTLAGMVSALICSGQLSLPAWEPYVPRRAKQAWLRPQRSAIRAKKRRWHRFFSNALIRVNALYIPLALLALKDWQSHRLYIALDTERAVESLLHDSFISSMLWSRCAISMAGTRTQQFCRCLRDL